MKAFHESGLAGTASTIWASFGAWWNHRQGAAAPLVVIVAARHGMGHRALGFSAGGIQAGPNQCHDAARSTALRALGVVAIVARGRAREQ